MRARSGRLFPKIAILLMLTLTIFSAASCGRSHQLTGKWRAMRGDPPMIWEFSADGSVTQGGVRGRYSFGDNERIKIETPFATSVYQVEIAGDRLTLIDARGAKLEFVRAGKR